MNERQSKALLAAYRALCVINLDDRINHFLMQGDIMARKQVSKALDELEISFRHLPVPEGRKGQPADDVQVLIRDINAFLDADDKLLRGDAVLFTKKEWRERGEEYGNDAELTLVIDGSPMHDALNYGSYGWGTQERFQAMLRSHGFHMELGYSWTVHIYRDVPSYRSVI